MVSVWALILILAGFCWAGPQNTKGDAGGALSGVTMDEVVVTATRQEEKISSVPANVSVITEADIGHATAINIPDLLRTHGIHVNDIAGNGRNYSVDIRGFGETAPLNTLVLVDGRRINQADLSGTDWTLIPLDRVKRIEIIRGGRGSTLYGDNAAGGVINIITKEGEALKYGAEVNAGSYDTFKGSAYLSGTQQNLSYAISGSYYNSDGYRNNSNTEAKDLGLNLSYYAGDRIKLDLSSGFHKDNTGLPGAIKESEFAAGASRTDTLQPDDFADIEDNYVKGGMEFYFFNDSMFKLDASLRKRFVTTFASFSAGNFTGDTDIESLTVSPQIILKEQVLGYNNSLTLGLDFVDVNEDIINDSLFFGTRSVGIFNLKKENYAFFIHDEFKPRDNWAISGGYRYDRAKFNFTPSTPDQETMSEDAYTAGINYTFAQKSSAYFSYSRSFRYPVIDEIFSFFNNTLDTSLTPQTSDDYEFGIRHYLTPSLYANINFFYIETKDEIVFNPVAFVNQNLDGKTRRQGIEATITKTYTKVTLYGNYTHTDATIVGGQFNGNNFPNVPEHKATVGALLPLRYGFSLTVNGNYLGKRPFISDFSNAVSDQEDYFVLNAKFKYNWKYLTGFLNINNVTDEEYSEYGVISTFPVVERGFYPSPGINFLVGVSVDF